MSYWGLICRQPPGSSTDLKLLIKCGEAESICISCKQGTVVFLVNRIWLLFTRKISLVLKSPKSHTRLILTAILCFYIIREPKNFEITHFSGRIFQNFLPTPQNRQIYFLARFWEITTLFLPYLRRFYEHALNLAELITIFTLF